MNDYTGVNIQTYNFCSIVNNEILYKGSLLRYKRVCVLQVAVYHALSFVDLTDTDHILSKNIVKEMKEMRFGANVRDRLKGIHRKKEQGPVILEVFNKVTKKPILPVQPYKKKPSKIKKAHRILQKKVNDNLPPVLTESETQQVHGKSKRKAVLSSSCTSNSSAS